MLRCNFFLLGFLGQTASLYLSTTVLSTVILFSGTSFSPANQALADFSSFQKVNFLREGCKKNKKILNVHFFQIGVHPSLPPPPLKCKLFYKNFKKSFGVPKLLMLLSELTKTHSCVKEIYF